MAIRTIFDTVQDCSIGARQGWFEFIRDYAPITRTLLQKYFPALSPELDNHVVAVFARAHADQNAWFPTLRFTNEREFAMPFRDLVLAYGRSVERFSPALTTEDLARALDGLSLIQRQCFWGFLKGWNVEEISAMLMNASATAQETKATADERLSLMAGPPGSADRPAAARAAIEVAQSTSSADCLSWKTCNNLVNGQISWLDRQRAEQHIADCLHCLNNFTAFQEMIWLRKTTLPAASSDAERILSALNLQSESKGLLSRLFSRAS
jgi:hypothetical protein